MRTAIIAAVALVALCCVGPAPAQAKDMNGKLGVGLEQSLGGVTGLAIRYWPGAAFGIMGVLGVDIVSVKEEDRRGLATTFTGSVGFAYNFARSLHANLSAGARLALGYESERAARLEDPARTSGILQVIIEVPVALEFFLSDNFSVGVATGLMFVFVPKDGAALDGEGHGSTKIPRSIGIGIGSGAITGTLSAVYYF
ncbi:MAG: hypothetical protein H6746_13475 [Deltaproteobacteria bacterium]|nr:hypothetical protein [Deltaproteobacteria bacterium]